MKFALIELSPLDSLRTVRPRGPELSAGLLEAGWRDGRVTRRYYYVRHSSTTVGGRDVTTLQTRMVKLSKKTLLLVSQPAPWQLSRVCTRRSCLSQSTTPVGRLPSALSHRLFQEFSLLIGGQITTGFRYLPPNCQNQQARGCSTQSKPKRVLIALPQSCLVYRC